MDQDLFNIRYQQGWQKPLKKNKNKNPVHLVFGYLHIFSNIKLPQKLTNSVFNLLTNHVIVTSTLKKKADKNI